MASRTHPFGPARRHSISGSELDDPASDERCCLVRGAVAVLELKMLPKEALRIKMRKAFIDNVAFPEKFVIRSSAFETQF
jgi:hypothetical protein